MARKQNLSDLIQTEAQKLTPNSAVDESAIEVKAMEVSESTTSVDEEKITETTEPTPTKRNVPTKADLEATIKDLQSALEKTQVSETALQKQLQDLQSVLEKTQASETALQKQVQDLQSVVSEQQASIERLTQELDETKQTALQLAEANSKLIEENQASQQPKPAIVKQSKVEYTPVNYRKSHRVPEKLPDIPAETKDDFASNTWLYD